MISNKKRLDYYSHSLSAVPLELIRLTGRLSNKRFPRNVCCNSRITRPVSNPAYDSIRIDRDRVSGVNVTQNNRVSIGEYSNIGIGATSGQRGRCKSFLRKDTHTYKSDAVVAILGKSQNILRLDRNGFSHTEMIYDHMLAIVCLAEIKR